MYLKQASAEKCFVSLESLEDVPFIILGDIFLRNYLVVFDKPNNSVGLLRYGNLLL